MKKINYIIKNFNPNNESSQDNQNFTNGCKILFSDRDSFKYLSYTGIPYTEQQHEMWRKTFDPDTKEYLIAVHNNKIIGLCIILKDPLNKFEITGVIVQNQFRQQGIGKDLIHHAIKRANLLTYRSVELDVFCDNIPMLITVLKAGFKPKKIDYHKRYDGEDIMTLVKYL